MFATLSKRETGRERAVKINRVGIYASLFDFFAEEMVFYRPNLAGASGVGLMELELAGVGFCPFFSMDSSGR